MYLEVFLVLLNYALRRTAIENKSKYSKDAAETLKNNFYIDYMLKSV